MADIYVYAYVEDEPTEAVLKKMIEYVNSYSRNRFLFCNGAPVITRGYGNLKNTACRFIRAEKSGIWSIFVTDLDQFETVHSLCNNWFGLSCFRQLPSQMIFRIAVREVESWIIADKEGIAEFLNVAVANFTDLPDNISDPKQFIFKVIRHKCRNKKYKEMLPLRGQAIGIEYNPQIVSFITNNWNIENAMNKSPSLKRAIQCFASRLSSI